MRKSMCVIQFAKWPVLGNVKTRLAADLGDEKAREVHLQLAEQVFKNLSLFSEADIQIHVDKINDCHDELDNGVFDAWSRNALLTLQKGAGLGERMASAIVSTLTSYEKVVIVGSDCPGVDADYLESAFTALERADMVLGPAEDGGYVLIGFSKFSASVFNEVEWGGSDVLYQTLANAKRLQISTELLSEQWDVDELKDYYRWRK